MKKIRVIEKIAQSSGLAVLLMSTGLPPCLATKNATLASDKVNIVWQDISIKGKVVDKSGESLPGAAIRILGKEQGAVTDFDGQFTITANKGDKLEISFIGYITKTVVANNSNELVIVLEEDSKTLDEVVVVGYGTQKKVNLTGAVASVSSDALESRPITNLSQGLQGMIGNLNISASNGSPGKGYGFNVRGTTSINSAGPLVLVDGVQMDPNLVNPADVESVSVLKDAASASIYGTQAAYGVVLITTKKGKDQRAKISLSGNWSSNSPTRIPEYMDSWTFANFHNMTNRNSGGGDYYDRNYMEHIYAYYTDPKHNLPVFIDPSNPNKYLYCGNTDWIEETRKKHTLTQQYTLSINGGTGKTSYYGSLGFMDQEGQLKHYDDNYRRVNASLNVNTEIRKWLQIGMKINYNNTKHDTPFGTNSNDMEAAFYGADLRPFMPVYHPDGNYSGQGSWTNMVATQAISGSRVHKENDLWLTGSIKINPLKGWNIHADYTYNMYIRHKKYHGKEIVEHYANPEVTTIFPHITPSSVKFTSDDDYYQVFNAYTDYEHNFGKHGIKLLAGYNYERKDYRWFDAERQNLISQDIASLGMAYGEKYNGSGEHAWATMGYFARLNYNYDDRYLLELNGRYDGSSKFPKDNRFAFFPSFSAAWRISNEAFFANAGKYVDELKFRASYGSLGNQSVGGDYPYISTMKANGEMGYLVDGKKIASVSPGGIVSPILTWETVRQIDFGLDWVALNNRLYGTFDWYRRMTYDMVTDGIPLPAVLGTGAPQANTADLKTTGWELNIGWRDRLKNDFSYDVSLVLSDYKAEITKFNNPEKLLSKHYAGKQWGEIWGFVTEGIFQNEEEVANHVSQSEIYGGEWYPGDVKYKNLDGDDKISYGKNTVDNPGDRKIIGNSEPRYCYGIKADAQWKSFDLSIFFQGVGKKDVELGGNQFWGFGSEWHVPFLHTLDCWTEENRNAYFPRSTYDNVTGNRQTQTRYLQDASYLRLKNLTIGYTLPKSLLEKWKIDNVRIYMSGQNLLTFDHLFDIYDPETVSISSYPLQKSISFGLNITL
ncbi:TonB-dependent receptor [uncultured Bacteroides sp.]|uniref:SusC/RagA family TonB-linked outer membrane protein n=1 Tax=uncultured Bacteroides sp. TaxID=162156 RepID=UPI0025B09F86|nr:TonB-dependent receptor [uncultured Bacteroides sp.]